MKFNESGHRVLPRSESGSIFSIKLPIFQAMLSCFRAESPWTAAIRSISDGMRVRCLYSDSTPTASVRPSRGLPSGRTGSPSSTSQRKRAPCNWYESVRLPSAQSPQMYSQPAHGSSRCVGFASAELRTTDCFDGLCAESGSVDRSFLARLPVPQKASLNRHTHPVAYWPNRRPCRSAGYHACWPWR